MSTIPLANIRAAIFDMDGTMIDNMKYHQQAWQAFFRQHGIALTEAEFKQRVSGKKNDQIFTSIFGKTLDKVTEQRYTEEKEALYRQLFRPYMQEIPGLTKLINALHERRIKTAIATTAPAKNREFALRELQLEGEFEAILGDEDVTNGKPHPEIYLATAQRLNVAPDQCLVFEDSPAGVAAGKRAGMTVVGVLSSHSALELHEANYLVHDFRDVTLA